MIVATTKLIALMPLLILTAIAVRLTSSGPALFRQERTGRYGESFTIYKFRSMRTDAEKNGAQWASKKDARVTSIGGFLRKSRIDELPQLWNIIKGDMSLVGPRPERPVFNEQLVEQLPYYDLRHLVRPGVTGWAQVKYPYGASVEDAKHKLEYDIYYVRHGSLMFDVRIIVRTLATVFGLKGR